MSPRIHARDAMKTHEHPPKASALGRFARACLLLTLISGCGDKSASTADRPSVAETPAVVTEHQPVPVAQATRAVGEACDTGGASECRSGICLRTGADPATGHFCSVQCQDEADCPRTWRCTRLHPSAGGRACMPPEGWKSTVAETR
ncbi:hypothetical protein JY651_14950 [Pyxidicoccus parkwayensis]|uniref:Lipoprotein n=1 Tax=Pyxidicoccus parkwayensis TaxID=2813578 RepID=A0ABX7P6R6_9BACT|nr:hypothetical protein [Pyxidicoccus parkwaysis]QSQ26144.1 hypothetical protein JY651_14950 [Pyxidicoccus parkwaysis]